MTRFVKSLSVQLMGELPGDCRDACMQGPFGRLVASVLFGFRFVVQFCCDCALCAHSGYGRNGVEGINNAGYCIALLFVVVGTGVDVHRLGRSGPHIG